MERRTVLGLIGLAAPGLASCTLLGPDDPPPPAGQPDPPATPDPQPTDPGQPDPGSADDATVEPWVVKGRASYADGRPLVGAEVLANNTLGYNSYLSAVTDADGRYRIPIDESVMTTWRMWATVDIEYHGQWYERELDHDGIPFPSDEGAIRDLVLTVTGPLAQSGPGNTDFLGGEPVHVLSTPESEGYVEIDEVQVTLAPTGPLIDGSTGETIVQFLEYSDIADVPIGEYVCSVAHHAADGTVTPLQVRTTWEEGPLFDSVTALIPADGELELYYHVPEGFDVEW